MSKNILLLLALLVIPASLGFSAEQLDPVERIDLMEAGAAYQSRLKKTSVHDAYTFKQLMTKTRTGLVYKGKNKNTGALVAIRQVDFLKLSKIDQKLEEEGIAILMQCDHPNIVKVYDVFLSSGILSIVMELLEGYELFEYISKFGPLDEAFTKCFSRYIAFTLEYLHQRGVMHRDVKAENLVFRSAGDNPDLTSLVLIDFGFATIIPDKENQASLIKLGTMSYLAPELLHRVSSDRYNESVDVWAFIVVIYASVFKRLPFGSSGEENVERNIYYGRYYKGPLFFNLSESLQLLITSVFDADPKKNRLTISEILRGDWFIPKDGATEI